MTQTPPKDGPGVEIAPNVFIPMNRYEELLAFVECNHDVAEAIFEIELERTSVDPLTDDICTAVPFDFQATLHWNLAMRHMDKSILSQQDADRVRHAEPHNLFYGS